MGEACWDANRLPSAFVIVLVLLFDPVGVRGGVFGSSFGYPGVRPMPYIEVFSVRFEVFPPMERLVEEGLDEGARFS